MNIREIITKMGFGNQAVITAFKHEDDDSDYAVWKIEDGNVIRVLKKTSKQELDIYDTFLSFKNKVKINIKLFIYIYIIIFIIIYFYFVF